MGGDVGTGKLFLFCLVEAAVILAGVSFIWIGLRRNRWWARLGFIVVGASVLLLVPQYELFARFSKKLLWDVASDWVRDETIYFACVIGIVLLTITLTGLLTVWAALGRGYWFARIGLMVVVLGLLLAVPAHEVLLILLAQLLVAGIPLAIIRRVRDRNEGQTFWQFTIRDLLLFTFVCAALLGIGASIPASTWFSWNSNALLPMAYLQPDIAPWCYYLILGGQAGVLTLVATWIVFSQCVRWKRLVVLFALIPFAYTGMYWWLLHKTAFWSGSRKMPVIFASKSQGKTISCDEFAVLLVAVAFILMALWLTLLRGSHFAHAGSLDNETRTPIGRRKWLRWICRSALIMLSLLLLVPMGTAYWILAFPDPIPKIELPEPNGYHQLVALAEKVGRIDIPMDRHAARDDSKASKPQEFIAFAQQQEKLLAEIKEAIELPSCVPLKFSHSDIESIDATDYQFWDLGLVSLAAGHARCYQEDYEGGAQWYVDTIRLGRKCYRGGIWYSGWECGGLSRRGGMFTAELMAQRAIHDARQKMSQKVRQRLLKTLQNLGEEDEPFKTVLHRDHIWQQHAMGWAWRMKMALEMKPLPNIDEIEHGVEYWVVFLMRARHRLLIVELALENYRDDHGRYPEKLDELVPNYLDKLPVDPFGNGPFCYRVTGKDCRVYSVGRNGKDDGGQSKEERGDQIIVDDMWYHD